jgi:voltage-gated potassium channel
VSEPRSPGAGRAGSREQRFQWRDTVVSFLLVVAATAVYYVLPVPSRMREASWAVMFSCGVIVLGVLIVLAIRRLLRASEVIKVRGLVLLLCVTVLFFSWADRSVAALPDQFVSLSTKTDALYFNVSTLSTVGFGDVHPVGQLARAAVTLQIVFNLVFLGTAVAMITGFMRERARRRLHVSRPPPDEGRAAGSERG